VFTQTRYDGPDELVTVTVGPHAIRLWRPADPDRLLDDPDVLALNCRDDYMPYWAYVWPGALILAEAVVQRGAPPDDQLALEIGCGLGLAGLALLAVGGRVRFTDHDATPLRYVRRSIAANGYDQARASTALLDWRDLPEDRYGLILGADVLYERRLVPLVARLIRRLLSPDGLALVGGPYRSASEGLTEALAAQGLVARSETLEVVGLDGRPQVGTVHEIRRDGSTDGGTGSGSRLDRRVPTRSETRLT
jgi:predicted nicotinamide N-methyase